MVFKDINLMELGSCYRFWEAQEEMSPYALQGLKQSATRLGRFFILREKEPAAHTRLGSLSLEADVNDARRIAMPELGVPDLTICRHPDLHELRGLRALRHDCLIESSEFRRRIGEPVRL